MSLRRVTGGPSSPDAASDDIDQLVDLLNGQAGRGQPVFLTALSDAANPALSVRNLDTTNGRVATLYGPAGNVLLQVDKNGVLASPDGVAAAAQVLTTSSTITTDKVFATLTNKSGGQVVQGDVVVLDPTNDGAFTTTSTANDPNRLGVVYDTSIANNGAGKVLLAGQGLVRTAGAVTRDDYLATSTTPKQAANSSLQQPYAFARALATAGGGGLVSALLLGPGAHALAGLPISGVLGANVNPVVAAWSDVLTISLPNGTWQLMGKALMNVPNGQNGVCRLQVNAVTVDTSTWHNVGAIALIQTLNLFAMATVTGGPVNVKLQAYVDVGSGAVWAATSIGDVTAVATQIMALRVN